MRSIILSLLGCLVLCWAAVARAEPQLPKMAVSKNGMVVTCQPLAAQIGVDILRAGGNAADAFIATTLAEYVTAFARQPPYLGQIGQRSRVALFL